VLKLSSRTEQITSEVRRLVLTARSLQAQLDQSIPKKTHEEVIARMQGTIDGMAAELRRTKNQLDETQSIGQGLSILVKQVAAQGETVREAAMKISEVTVPNHVYQNATTRISDLEQVLNRKDQEMQSLRDQSVSKDQYIRAETRISELENVLANSMPKTEFETLTQQIDTLTKAAPVVMDEVIPSSQPMVQTVQITN
jgi:hypothetical protein